MRRRGLRRAREQFGLPGATPSGAVARERVTAGAVAFALVTAGAGAQQAPEPGALIFARSCLPCHARESPVGLDFSTPEVLRRRAPTAAAVVRSGLMPPWLPSTAGAPLSHARLLTQTDRATLIAWLDRGAPIPPLAARAIPLSSTTALPAAKPWAPVDAGLSIRIADGWQVEADPGMKLRSFAVASPTESDLLVRTIEMRADEPGLVHAVSLLWDETGFGARLDRGDPLPGYDAVGDIGLQWSGSGGSVSRLMPRFGLPAGYAIRIPAQATLVAEVHAEGRGKVESPGITVRLYPPYEPVRVLQPLSFSGVRPVTVTEPITAVAINIRASSRVQSIQVVAIDSTGIARTLLDIPEWNERLAEPWIFEPPVVLAAGSELVVRSTLSIEAKQFPLDAHAAAMSIPTVVVLVARDDDPICE